MAPARSSVLPTRAIRAALEDAAAICSSREDATPICAARTGAAAIREDAASTIRVALEDAALAAHAASAVAIRGLPSSPPSARRA
ncbi:unnamed protein product [Miscanthus lutarioriparius]|uniref:Uncharacterized protein n=1 Tax=Miscanthus lutarioriparius TaxID=422564 RepID=A0A811P8G7_9POAL|nr:unnamed protein product [Miscanthus lutarioriparius]